MLSKSSGCGIASQSNFLVDKSSITAIHTERSLNVLELLISIVCIILYPILSSSGAEYNHSAYDTTETTHVVETSQTFDIALIFLIVGILMLLHVIRNATFRSIIITTSSGASYIRATYCSMEDANVIQEWRFPDAAQGQGQLGAGYASSPAGNVQGEATDYVNLSNGMV